MRHRKHNHQLGVKSAHRVSLVANLSCSLIEHGRIKTTLAKARALRPAIEKIITLAKKAHTIEDAAGKIHYRRLAIARLRNKKAVSKLFDELVEQFITRNGGYTRIYKLALPRLGDAADMALIEFVQEAPKKKTKKRKSNVKKSQKSPDVEDQINEDSDNADSDDKKLAKNQDENPKNTDVSVKKPADSKKTVKSKKQTKAIKQSKPEPQEMEQSSADDSGEPNVEPSADENIKEK